ncbi:hypothetical protein GGS20DRAFT_64717 [Poronia punctata]|nr:hypothetical protein GGS20DRAFT_64717 [Poronia punctata]
MRPGPTILGGILSSRIAACLCFCVPLLGARGKLTNQRQASLYIRPLVRPTFLLLTDRRTGHALSRLCLGAGGKELYMQIVYFVRMGFVALHQLHLLCQSGTSLRLPILSDPGSKNQR